MSIVFLTTWRQDVSAEEIRVKYFKKALLEKGFIVMHYRLRVTRISIYYMLRLGGLKLDESPVPLGPDRPPMTPQPSSKGCG